MKSVNSYTLLEKVRRKTFELNKHLVPREARLVVGPRYIRTVDEEFIEIIDD